MISVLIASIVTSTNLTFLDWVITLFAGSIVLLIGWYFSYMVAEFGKKPYDPLARKFREEVENRNAEIQNRKNKY